MQLLNKIFHRSRPTLGKIIRKSVNLEIPFQVQDTTVCFQTKRAITKTSNAPIRTTISPDAPAQSGDTPDINGHHNRIQQESTTCLFPHRSSPNF